MMTEEKTKAPTWFMVVGIILLLWNAIGILNFFGHLMTSEEDLQLLSEAQRQFHNGASWYSLLGFGLGVFCGTIGGLGLVLKKKFAAPAFIVSLLGVLVQTGHNLTLGIDELMGMIVGFAVMLIIVGSFSIWLAKYGEKKGWIK